eukprot:COSAG01_NODE_13058_length_1642_cov_84.754375_1_plen_158_part_00
MPTPHVPTMAKRVIDPKCRVPSVCAHCKKISPPAFSWVIACGNQSSYFISSGRSGSPDSSFELKAGALAAGLPSLTDFPAASAWWYEFWFGNTSLQYSSVAEQYSSVCRIWAATASGSKGDRCCPCTESDRSVDSSYHSHAGLTRREHNCGRRPLQV